MIKFLSKVLAAATMILWQLLTLWWFFESQDLFLDITDHFQLQKQNISSNKYGYPNVYNIVSSYLKMTSLETNLFVKIK